MKCNSSAMHSTVLSRRGHHRMSPRSPVSGPGFRDISKHQLALVACGTELSINAIFRIQGSGSDLKGSSTNLRYEMVCPFASVEMNTKRKDTTERTFALGKYLVMSFFYRKGLSSTMIWLRGRRQAGIPGRTEISKETCATTRAPSQQTL